MLYGAVCKASAVLWKSRRITALTSVLLMVYYPTVVYVSYLYGTLLSAAFCSLGLCAALLLSETGKVRYGVLMACAFPLGILAHQSAAIGLVAAVLYLLVQGGKREFFRNLVPAALTVLLFLLCSKAVDTVYTDITGADPQADPVPAVCTIYMGITATEGSAGPGSQDGSYVEIFNDNNADGRQASRDALQRIAVVAGEYLTGKRSLSFFLEKVKYQWLDPTFGARKTIVMNDPNVGDPPNSEAFVKFYDSSVRTIAFKLLTGFMLLIYFGSLAGGLRVIRGGRTGLGGMLPALFVLGGIAFQLIWESFSRYCFCYFIWLVPVAACGIDWCCRLLTGDGRQRRETYAARKSAIFH